MRYVNNEYYYNWYAASANPTTNNPNSYSCGINNDVSSLGSICPLNWHVAFFELAYGDLKYTTSGHFVSGSQQSLGNYGEWWSGRNSSNNLIIFGGSWTDVDASSYNYGLSVRCVRSM